MADSSSNGGIGPIDVGTVVDKLMAYQSLKLYRIQSTRSLEQVQISAYGTLKNLFSTFQTKLSDLKDAFATSAFSATSSDTNKLTASVTSNNLSVGSHSIQVTNLAKSQIFKSGAVFSSRSTAQNINGSLTFTNTTTSTTKFTITVDPADSLDKIRDKINGAADNVGVTASIVSSTNGMGDLEYNLIVTSKSGTKNQVAVTGTAAASFNLNQTSAGEDAIFTFDGYSQVRSSNTITDVMDGLSFNLLATGNSTIDISADDKTKITNVKTAMQNMLSSYNQLITLLDGGQYVKVYDEVNRQNLSGFNSSFQLIKSQLQNAMNTAFGSGEIRTLKGAGIIINPAQKIPGQYDKDRLISSSGSLSIDATLKSNGSNMTQFDWALNNNLAGLESYITNASSGLIANVNKVLDKTILPQDKAGMIWNSTSALQSVQKNTDQKIDNEKLRLQEMRENLIAKYSSLNAVLSKYQGLSDYLKAQYSYMNNIGQGK